MFLFLLFIVFFVSKVTDARLAHVMLVNGNVLMRSVTPSARLTGTPTSLHSMARVTLSKAIASTT